MRVVPPQKRKNRKGEKKMAKTKWQKKVTQSQRHCRHSVTQTPERANFSGRPLKKGKRKNENTDKLTA